MTSTYATSALALLTAAFVAMIAGLPGCSAQSQREERIVHRPLDFDPTDEYELSRWWSNGRQLLRLDRSGSYTIYPSTNRYHAPEERGRWEQPSYAHLIFKPYRHGSTESRRIPLNKINDQIAIMLPGREPMFGIHQPPDVLEDELLGRWRGPDGKLSLSADLRYVFDPAEDVDSDAIVRLGRHHGSWTIQGEKLVLQPDSPRISPMTLNIDDGEDEDDERLVLRSETGELRSLRPRDAEAE